MHLVSVVNDGRLTMYAAGADELVEVARILVPEGFSAEASAALGLNIAAATGLGDGGPAPVVAEPQRALPPAPARRGPGRPRKNAGPPTRSHTPQYELIAQQVRMHPGATIALMVTILGWDRKTVSNAMQQARMHKLVRNDPGRGWFAINR